MTTCFARTNARAVFFVLLEEIERRKRTFLHGIILPTEYFNCVLSRLLIVD